MSETSETPKMEAVAAPALPEVRQCQDSEHFLYGAAAVQNSDAGKWGVMHPVNGGHWATDDEVADWPVLS